MIEEWQKNGQTWLKQNKTKQNKHHKITTKEFFHL